MQLLTSGFAASEPVQGASSQSVFGSKTAGQIKTRRRGNSAACAAPTWLAQKAHLLSLYALIMYSAR